MHLKQFVLSDQFSDYFIDRVVKLKEFLSFVMLVGKYLLLDVHFHVKQKLEKKLADSQIFADHLSLLDWVNVFEFCLFMHAVFQKLLNFKDFFGDLHHSKVVNLLCSLDRAPFQVLSQVNDN